MTQPSSFGPVGASTVQTIGVPGTGAPGAPGAQGPQGAVANAATHAALLAQTGVAGTVMMVAARSTPGDGGGGRFSWRVGTPPADNGGTIRVPPSQSAGWWQMDFSGPHDVRWFGAKGDYTGDSTSAIQAALDAAHANAFSPSAPGGAVYVPAGGYMISGPLRGYPGVRLFGDNYGSASVNGSIIQALSSFSGDSMFKMNTQSANNWGAGLERLTFYLPNNGQGTGPLYGVDWSGVIAGTIRGLTVRTANGIMRSNCAGLYFSGDSGNVPDNTHCYSNLIETVNIDLVSTALRCKTDSVGGMTLCCFLNIYLQQCDVAIDLITNGAGLGVMFMNGYVNPNSGGKLVKVTGGNTTPTLQVPFHNIQWETAGNPTSDLPVINGVLASFHGSNEPAPTVVCEGMIAQYDERRILQPYPGSMLGQSAATPMLPTSTNFAGSLRW